MWHSLSSHYHGKQYCRFESPASVSATFEVGVQQGSLACRLLVHSQEIGLMGSRIEGTKVDLTERRELTANTIAIAYKSGPASS